MYTLQTLDRFFKWDRENIGGQGEGSVIAYFEGEGGYQLLDEISTNVQSMEIYTMTIEMMQRYFRIDNEDD
jgi:hypothetical protein